jgi:NTP pyrophosphatase (non-canonical NTP hydrolase)
MNEPITLSTAQSAVDESILEAGGYWPPLANLARLFEECGELARAVNQSHGPKVKKPGEDAVAVQEELGDCLYVLLVLANSLGVDAEAGLEAAVTKVRQRSMGLGGEAVAGSGSPEMPAETQSRQD